MATFCSPIKTNEQLQQLRRLFDGERAKDVDGKEVFVGDIIRNHYGKSSEGFGNKMFEEIC